MRNYTDTYLFTYKCCRYCSVFFLNITACEKNASIPHDMTLFPGGWWALLHLLAKHHRSKISGAPKTNASKPTVDLHTQIFWRRISNLPKRSEGTWSNKQKKSKNRSLDLRNMYSVFEVFSTFITFNPFSLWKHQSMLSYLWEATPNMEPVFANGARSQNLMGSGQPSNLSNEKKGP